MDIHFLLFLKKKYETIIFCLNEILKEYNEINETYKTNETYKITDLYIELNNYIFELNKNTELLKDINNKIQEICQHEFVEDDIDVSPDKSQKICYCKNCQYSKP